MVTTHGRTLFFTYSNKCNTKSWSTWEISWNNANFHIMFVCQQWCTGWRKWEKQKVTHFCNNRLSQWLTKSASVPGHIFVQFVYMFRSYMTALPHENLSLSTSNCITAAVAPNTVSFRGGGGCEGLDFSSVRLWNIQTCFDSWCGLFAFYKISKLWAFQLPHLKG